MQLVEDIFHIHPIFCKTNIRKISEMEAAIFVALKYHVIEINIIKL